MKKSPKGWNVFLKLCYPLSSPEEIELFLDLFLTIEEKHHLASRCLIIQELLKGKLTQREIAERHGVSIAQITRGSNALKRIDSKMEQFLKEHLV